MKDGKLHHRTPNLTGQTFGYLTVISHSHTDGTKNYWLVRCQCGKHYPVVGSELTRCRRLGRTPSCGCMTSAMIKKARITHGMSQHPVFAVWRSMLARCQRKTHQAWRNYGARGISVCEHWQKFENFWADMQQGYAPGLSLERINNDGNYHKENCTWATRREQACNKRSAVKIHTPNGLLNVSEAAVQFGIGVTTILYRISQGWPEDQLLIKPDFRQRSKRSMT